MNRCRSERKAGRGQFLRAFNGLLKDLWSSENLCSLHQAGNTVSRCYGYCINLVSKGLMQLL